MKVLILGSGAREHALGWKISKSSLLSGLYFAPGNSGTARIGANIQLDPKNFPEIVEWVKNNKIDFTVVGPENPLVSGIVDRFKHEGLSIFGPVKAAAKLESSKVWAKEFLFRHRIPTASAQAFRNLGALKSHLDHEMYPLVLKADGLAQGKGVVVCTTKRDALQTADDFMSAKVLGDAGATILVEEFLPGEELSAFALCDGNRFCYLGEARDYKRAFDGDQGPNTGGMGAVSYPELIDDSLRKEICDVIFKRTLEGLKNDGIIYQGLLYAGLMLTPKGLNVLEFNVRFGDPETQVLLPRIERDLLELLNASACGILSADRVTVSRKACVGVVIAAEGYPEKPAKGLPLPKLPADTEELVAFHASTAVSNGVEVNQGGRTLTVTGLGDSLESARKKVYGFIEKQQWNRYFYRKDIGEHERRLCGIRGLQQKSE